jgi:hypothetical protein
MGGRGTRNLTARGEERGAQSEGDGTVGGVFPGDKSFVRPGNGLKAGGVSGSAGNPLKNYASRDETTVLQTTGGF